VRVALLDPAMRAGKRGFERTKCCLERAGLRMAFVLSWTPTGAVVAQRHALLDAIEGARVLPASEAAVRSVRRVHANGPVREEGADLVGSWARGGRGGERGRLTTDVGASWARHACPC
jgi:hypothetical protein